MTSEKGREFFIKLGRLLNEYNVNIFVGDDCLPMHISVMEGGLYEAHGLYSNGRMHVVKRESLIVDSEDKLNDE